MAVKYEITDEAEIELHRIKCYFEFIGKEEAFFDDFIEQIKLIIELPLAFQIRYSKIRIVLLKRFNYSIHYRVMENGTIKIYRILNQNQDF